MLGLIATTFEETALSEPLHPRTSRAASSYPISYMEHADEENQDGS